MNPTLSIIVPVYYNEETLPRVFDTLQGLAEKHLPTDKQQGHPHHQDHVRHFAASQARAPAGVRALEIGARHAPATVCKKAAHHSPQCQQV